jgi:NAD(P) transhydrogenase subunit alpha
MLTHGGKVIHPAFAKAVPSAAEPAAAKAAKAPAAKKAAPKTSKGGA